MIHPKTSIMFVLYFCGPLCNNLQVNIVVYCGNKQRLRVYKTTTFFNIFRVAPDYVQLVIANKQQHF